MSVQYTLCNLHSLNNGKKCVTYIECVNMFVYSVFLGNPFNCLLCWVRLPGCCHSPVSCYPLAAITSPASSNWRFSVDSDDDSDSSRTSSSADSFNVSISVATTMSPREGSFAVSEGRPCDEDGTVGSEHVM